MRAWLYGESETIDGYMRQLRYGFHASKQPKKPVRRFTPWWTAILDVLLQQRVLGWTEVALVLLSIGFDEQVKIDRHVRRTTRTAKRHWGNPSHINATIYTSRATALAIVAYKGTAVSSEERDRMITDAGSSALEGTGLNRALVIGVDVDRDDDCRDHPYAALTWVYDKAFRAPTTTGK